MVISIKPKSQFLSRYILDFSTFKKGCDLTINFAAFPSVGPALALFKNATLIKEHNPDAKVWILHRDLMACGNEFETYYHKAMENGVRFIRYTLEKLLTLRGCYINE